MAAALPPAAGAGAGRLSFVPMATISEIGNETTGSLQAPARISIVKAGVAERNERIARIAQAKAAVLMGVESVSAESVLAATAAVRDVKEIVLKEARDARTARAKAAIAGVAKENAEKQVAAAIANLARLTISSAVRSDDEKEQAHSATAAAAREPALPAAHASALLENELTLDDMELKGITLDFQRFLTSQEFHSPYAPYCKRDLGAEMRLTTLGCPIQCEQLNRKSYLAIFKYYKTLYEYQCAEATYKLCSEELGRSQQRMSFSWEEVQAARQSGMSVVNYVSATMAERLEHKKNYLLMLEADVKATSTEADAAIQELNAEIERIKAIYEDKWWKATVAAAPTGAAPAAAQIPEGIELSPEGYDLRRTENSLQSLAQLFAQIKVKYGKDIQSGAIKELTFYMEGCPFMAALFESSVLRQDHQEVHCEDAERQKKAQKKDVFDFSSMPDGLFRNDAVVQLLAIFYGTPVDVTVRLFYVPKNSRERSGMGLTPGYLRIKKLHHLNGGGAFQRFEWKHSGGELAVLHRGYLIPAVEKGAPDNDAPKKDA